MLKINLVPFEELENKRWFVPDLLLYLVLGGGGWLGFNTYVETYQNKIAGIQAQINTSDQAIAALEPRITRVTALQGESLALGEQLTSLERITTAKIPRYRPVMLLEMLQKYKPEGLWFKSVNETTTAGSMTITGESYDKLLVAKFISALSSSKNKRTQIVSSPALSAQGLYFSRVNLQQLHDQPPAAPTEGKTRSRAAIQYEISLNYKEQQETSGG